MRIPVSWLHELVPAASDRTGRQIAEALLRVGMEVERVEALAIDALRVGQVRSFDEEPQKNGKVIRWCSVDVGEPEPRGIVCGAANFLPGDHVVVALPGAVLPGGFAIAARKTYGHVSDGMICSDRELGLGEDHAGILVLPDDTPVGVDANAVLGLNDEVLDIAVTPDRGYALSARGLARELAGSLGLGFIDPAHPHPPADPSTAAVLASLDELPPGIAVTIDDPTGCDYYLALTLDQVDPGGRSPHWLTQRLERTGMRAISLAVDVTNYVLVGLGQPLHAFDADKVTGTIRVRRALTGETLDTLDGVRRTLHPEDLLIADDSGPIALAGVMGGASTEITPTTRRVLLEAAHFDPVTIARAARRHRLGSEAARRFERGVDSALAPAAAAAAAALLVEHAGATPVAVSIADRRGLDVSVALPVAMPGAIGGRPVEPAAVTAALVAIGASVSGGDPLTVTVPSWRPDLRAPIDLVEEVLRLEGYDTLPSLLPTAPGAGGLTSSQRARRAMSRTLAAAGFVEVTTNPFTGPSAPGLTGADDALAVDVLNPLSAQESQLRRSLLPGVVAAAVRNIARGHADVALFEMGPVFHGSGGAAVTPPPPARRPSADVLAALDASLPAQPWHAAVILCGLAEPAGWSAPGRRADWADAVAAIQGLAAGVGLELRTAAAEHSPWHPGRCAALYLHDNLVGHAGELHPAAIEAMGLPPRSVAAEVDLEPLLAAAGQVVAMTPVSTFPAASVDVALVVAAEISAGAVTAALREGAGALLEELTLFDVYTGAPIPDGQRSLAYSLRLRAGDRTLSGTEITTARDAAVAAATAATGAALRA